MSALVIAATPNSESLTSEAACGLFDTVWLFRLVSVTSHKGLPLVACRVKSIWSDFWGACDHFFSLNTPPRRPTTNLDFIAHDNVLEVALGLM